MKGAFHGNESGSLPNFYYQSIEANGNTAEAQIKNALIKAKNTKNKNTQFIFEIGSNFF